jgi:hypothetical protein
MNDVDSLKEAAGDWKDPCGAAEPFFLEEGDRTMRFTIGQP